MSVAQYGLVGLRKAWTPSHDEYLIELLVQQHNSGKTTYNLFKHEVFKTVTRKLNSKFEVNLEESLIKKNYNAMKKDYGVLKAMLAHPGFYWDGDAQMVVADDKVWERYTAVRTDAKPYRWRSFPPIDQMSIIFEEPAAENGVVRIPQFPGRVNKAVEETNSDPETVQSSEPKEQTEQLADDSLDVDLTFYANNTQQHKKRKFGGLATAGCKDRASEAEDSIENAFCEIPSAVRLVQSNVKDKLPIKRKSAAIPPISGCDKRVQVEVEACIGNAVYDNVKDDRALYQQCLEELQRIVGLNDLEFAAAVNVLKDDKNAIAFTTIRGPRRLIWLRSVLHLQ